MRVFTRDLFILDYTTLDGRPPLKGRADETGVGGGNGNGSGDGSERGDMMGTGTGEMER